MESMKTTQLVYNMETGLHIAVISNIIFEPYFSHLIKRHFGKNTVAFPIKFGEYIEYQAKLTCANLIVVWLDLEAL